MIDPGVGSLCEPGNKYVIPWKTEKKWTLHVYEDNHREQYTRVFCVSAATLVFYLFLNEHGLNGPNTKEG
jgi:hypothetical protein